MRSLPLLPPARPGHLTVHPSKAVLVVACQGSDKLWEMRCMHPVTGVVLFHCLSFIMSSSTSLIITPYLMIILSISSHHHHLSSSHLPSHRHPSASPHHRHHHHHLITIIS